MGEQTGGIMGLLHALAMAIVIGGAFLIGCVISFLRNPLAWLSDFWLPILLMLIAIVGMIRDKKFWSR